MHDATGAAAAPKIPKGRPAIPSCISLINPPPAASASPASSPIASMSVLRTASPCNRLASCCTIYPQSPAVQHFVAVLPRTRPGTGAASRRRRFLAPERIDMSALAARAGREPGDALSLVRLPRPAAGRGRLVPCRTDAPARQNQAEARGPTGSSNPWPISCGRHRQRWHAALAHRRRRARDAAADSPRRRLPAPAHPRDRRSPDARKPTPAAWPFPSTCTTSPTSSCASSSPTPTSTSSPAKNPTQPEPNRSSRCSSAPTPDRKPQRTIGS